MQKILITISLLISFKVFLGQVSKNEISQIKTVADAEEFIKNTAEGTTGIVTLQSDIDTLKSFSKLYDKQVGFTSKIGNSIYKILQVDSEKLFRVTYIYLDGTKLSKIEIDKLRKQIISEYKAGTSFTKLVRQYNMDGSPGDTGWFPEGRMVKEFETAVKDHKKGDIFTVDTPAQNWYHVVLKTNSDKLVKKLTVLKVVMGG